MRYKGTLGLLELKKRPKTYEPEDFDAYEDILKMSNAMYKNDQESGPKSSGSYKWKGFVSQYSKYGSGLQTLFLLSNFDQFLDQLKLCTASYHAGNNGVRNKIVAILDIMKKGRFINDKEYVKIH